MKNRGKNEGSLWKEGTSWRAAITFNNHRLTKSFRSKEQCKTWLHEMKNQVNDGLTFNAVNLTLADFLNKWLDTNETRLRRKTHGMYKLLSEKYILPALGKKRIRELRREQIEQFYNSIGAGVRTVRFVHSVLHRCLSEAVAYGIIISNPSDRAVRPNKVAQEMEILTEIEVMQFLSSVQGTHYECLYNLAIRSGLRVGELLGLRWTDIDWERGSIRIQRQLQEVRGEGITFPEPKTKAGKRTIKIGQQMLQILSEQKKYQELKASIRKNWKNTLDLVFTSSIGTPVSVSNLRRDFKAQLERAGVKNIRFHDLRHTAVSIMLNHNTPVLVVSKMIGHSRPSITMDCYGHLLSSMLDDVAKLMDEVVTPIPIEISDSDTINSTCTYLHVSEKLPR